MTLDELEQDLATATSARDTLRARAAEHETWARESRAYAKEPLVPRAQERPEEPSGPEPTPEAVRAAADVLRAAERAATVNAERARQRRTTSEALARAEAELAVAQAEATRCEALLRAVRAAPTSLLDQAVEKLGDLGPMTIRAVPEAEAGRAGACVVVDVNGRPWADASSGERANADLWLRLGMRRALGRRALPVIFDDACLWTGAAPPVDGPVWRLLTTPDGGLTVRTG